MVIKQPTKYKIHKKDSVFGASVSELHTSELNGGFSDICMHRMYVVHRSVCF